MKPVSLGRFLIGLLVLAALVFAAACQTQTTQNNSNAASSNQGELARERVQGKRGGSLTYRVTSPPKSFNYLVVSDEPSLLVGFYLTGDRLVELDHDTQNYVPALAESWKLS
ncbi:MAG TPA: hypothetical protein VJT82_01775, partial [Pyrinomonadaceae bacterium]|nr:hypothetical protein [Pyrinomonadaceae bacterium]